MNKLLLCAIVACGFVAVSSYASEERREERREERKEIEWEKEKIERAELRDAVEKEWLVVGAEHKKALEELRLKLKEEKFEHVEALRGLVKEHRDLVDHLLKHIHEERERHRK